MNRYRWTTLALLAATMAAPAFSSDKSLSGSIQLAADHDHGAMAAQGAKGKGVVNAVDAAAHKVNLSHEAIPSLGWPAMKMDFAVAPSVDLTAVKAGTKVDFVVGKNSTGMPEIQSIQPAKK